MALKGKIQKIIVLMIIMLTLLIGVIFVSGFTSKEGEIDTVKEISKLEIDFLYLDLSRCERCQATDIVLDEALSELREELKDVKEITVNKIKILSDKDAEKYDFKRSPTIRINGKDIEEIVRGKLEIKDNYCGTCSEVCCEETNCRTFEYNGTTSDSIPKEMIKEAIMIVLGLKVTEESKEDEAGDSTCCPPSNQTSSCCPPNNQTSSCCPTNTTSNQTSLCCPPSNQTSSCCSSTSNMKGIKKIIMLLISYLASEKFLTILDQILSPTLKNILDNYFYDLGNPIHLGVISR